MPYCHVYSRFMCTVLDQHELSSHTGTSDFRLHDFKWLVQKSKLLQNSQISVGGDVEQFVPYKHFVKQFSQQEHVSLISSV